MYLFFCKRIICFCAACFSCKAIFYYGSNGIENVYHLAFAKKNIHLCTKKCTCVQFLSCDWLFLLISWFFDPFKKNLDFWGKMVHFLKTKKKSLIIFIDQKHKKIRGVLGKGEKGQKIQKTTFLGRGESPPLKESTRYKKSENIHHFRIFPNVSKVPSHSSSAEKKNKCLPSVLL